MAGRHGDEMDAIWAHEDPGLAMEEAVLKGRYVGLEAVRAYYVDWFDECLFGGMRQAMREMYPDVDPGPDTGAPFGVRLLHTLTTPMIEVAEDRETAKAVWLSPGYIAAPNARQAAGLLALGPLRHRLRPRRRRPGRSGTSGWARTSARRTSTAGWMTSSPGTPKRSTLDGPKNTSLPCMTEV